MELVNEELESASVVLKDKLKTLKNLTLLTLTEADATIYLRAAD